MWIMYHKMITQDLNVISNLVILYKNECSQQKTVIK